MLKDRHREPVNWRSVLLGLIGVIIICAFTPYNDYALNNTFLVGNNLPLGVVMLTFLFVLFVNGPLSRWAPRYAFNGGEIAVAFSMTLIACALPSSGLMRYLPNSIIMPIYQARQHGEFAWMFYQLDLPRWLFPKFAGSDIYEWMSDPIVTGYENRWTRDEPIPYMAWLTPALTWGIFLAAMYGALLCMIAIVRRQWHENERLPFPLAQIHLALIEPPKEGRWLNRVLRARAFWIAFAGVFLLHLWNGAGNYLPDFFPRIPTSYALYDLFSESPWGHADAGLKSSAVYFTVVGVTYFLTSSVAFSLWFFFIAQQIFRMWLGARTGDSVIYGQGDQHFGGIIAYVLVVLYIGRKHWGMVVRQAFRGVREGEPQGRYLSYRMAFWGLCICMAIMTGWMTFAGADVLSGFTTVMLLMLLFFIITRIIAETGIIHGQLQAPLYRPWQLLDQAGIQQPISLQSYYLVSVINGQHYDFREPMPVYASHGTRVADTAIYGNQQEDTPADRRMGRRFLLVLGVALAVGYFVSFGSMLWTEYTYGWTQDVSQTMPINDWGAVGMPRWMVMESTMQYERGHYQSPHNPAYHFGFGFVVTSILSYLRLRFTGWPLHPVGYLMLGTFPVVHLWFSFFVGWLLKTLIVRYGGARFYTNAKPFFFGLIVGESMAAGFWLILGVVLNALDLPYMPVNIMPA